MASWIIRCEHSAAGKRNDEEGGGNKAGGESEDGVEGESESGVGGQDVVGRSGAFAEPELTDKILKKKSRQQEEPRRQASSPLPVDFSL